MTHALVPTLDNLADGLAAHAQRAAETDAPADLIRDIAEARAMLAVVLAALDARLPEPIQQELRSWREQAGQLTEELEAIAARVETG